MAARKRDSVLSAYTRQLGMVPDHTIAEDAGVSRTLVVNYRKRLGIQAYNGYKQPAPASRHVAEVAPAAFRGRRSALDPYLAQLGRVPDREIAIQAGVTAENVRTYRQRRNIPPTSADARPGAVRSPAPATAQPVRRAEPSPGTPAATESRPSAATESTPAPAGTAFLITVDTDQGARSYAVVATSIAEAADAATQRLTTRYPEGVIRLIQRIAELLP